MHLVVVTQVRSAAAELHKVKLAAGGDPINVVRFCQQDMARVAELRAAVELELDSLKIHCGKSREELEEATRMLRANTDRIVTSEEQLAERADAIVVLSNKLDHALSDLDRLSAECDQRMGDALREQQARMVEQFEMDMEQRVRRLHEEADANRRAELATQKARLDELSQNRLEEMLAEQHHVLVAQLHKEAQDALSDLQSELNARNSRDLEALRTDMQNEREQAVAALEQRLRTVQNRAAHDLEEVGRSLSFVCINASLLFVIAYSQQTF